jgi:HPt (histidine-containing phosphotransfer) domain-containing protein
MNLKDLADDLGLDMDEFRELAVVFIETSLADLDRIRAGAREGHSTIVAGAAHSIKGAAGNLGFRGLYETARGLEMKARGDDLEDASTIITVLADELARLAHFVQDATTAA